MNPADATNTALNKRDRDGRTLTADKQSESRSDLEIAARIRREITKDGSLSTNAHNIKIITEDANVTLRGPVDSEQEKTTVVAEAQRIAGKAKVIDELEVKQR